MSIEGGRPVESDAAPLALVVTPAAGITPGTSVHRHDDGSECLWGMTGQKWYRMHPLYPLRECDRVHGVIPPASTGEAS